MDGCHEVRITSTDESAVQFKFPRVNQRHPHLFIYSAKGLKTEIARMLVALVENLNAETSVKLIESLDFEIINERLQWLFLLQ